MSDQEESIFEEFVEEKPKKSPPRTVKEKVTWFHEIKGFCICITESGDGYLVPSELCTVQSQLTFEIDLSNDNIQKLHGWDTEIEAILPPRKEMIHNIRKALWRNGAISKEAAKSNKVQQNLMRGAFPYRIEVIEE
jgi:hypothetical protein